MKEVFKKLSEINVNDKTDKKGKFTYLSWSFAWSELKKVSPTATAKVYHDENTNMPYFASKMGVIVKVGITVDGLEHINYLPVMDFKNKSKTVDTVDMMDINKAIQRCTTKAIALHGLGLYIYAGEDLPEVDIEDLLRSCKDLKELQEVYIKFTPLEKTATLKLKDELKTKLK
jgi:hypothetical protein